MWYMGRIVDEREACGTPTMATSSPTPNIKDGSDPSSLVKIHIHGESDTNDKWFPADSTNIALVAVIPTARTAIGELPTVGDCVALLLMDQALCDSLPITPTNEEQQQTLTLVGKVVQVLPAHDASIVDVTYPSWCRHAIEERRRIHIGNGYVSATTLHRSLERDNVSSILDHERSQQQQSKVTYCSVALPFALRISRCK